MKTKDSFDEKLRKMAADIEAQHKDIVIDTFLSIDSTHEVISRYLDMCTGNQEISQTGFKVLNCLIMYGNHVIPTEISKRIFRSKHSVSKVIFTLERHGLVEINSVGGDRRKREVSITKRGLSVAVRGNVYIRKKMSYKVMEILSEDEINLMRDMLNRIRKHTLALVKTKSV